MNNNLVPTPIVDKNGKQTTVRKRIDGGQSTSTALTSAKPVVAPDRRLFDALPDTPGTAGKMLKVALSNKDRKLSPKKTEVILEGLNPNTLASLDVLLSRGDRNWFIVQQCAEISAIARTLAPLNNLALYQHVWEPRHNANSFQSYIDGLQSQNLNEDEIKDYSFAPEEEQKKFEALLRAALDVGDQYTVTNGRAGGRGTYITNRNLAGLVLDRPDDVQRIIDVLQARPDLRAKTPDDIKYLVSLMEQESPKSLMDGLL